MWYIKSNATVKYTNANRQIQPMNLNRKLKLYIN